MACENIPTSNDKASGHRFANTLYKTYVHFKSTDHIDLLYSMWSVFLRCAYLFYCGNIVQYKQSDDVTINLQHNNNIFFYYALNVMYVIT